MSIAVNTMSFLLLVMIQIFLRRGFENLSTFRQRGPWVSNFQIFWGRHSCMVLYSEF